MSTLNTQVQALQRQVKELNSCIADLEENEIELKNKVQNLEYQNEDLSARIDMLIEDITNTFKIDTSDWTV